MAPVAMQEGEYVARVILNRLKGKETRSLPLPRLWDDGYNRSA